MLDRRRHAPVARPRTRRGSASARGLPQVYRGRARHTLADIYDADHAEGGHGGGFRWLLSTCLAATVGAIAIGIVIFGSLDSGDTVNGIPSMLKRSADGQSAGTPASGRAADGLRWAVPRSDRMQAMVGSPTIRQLIHEQIQVRRNGKAYIDRRPYLRVVTRLQPVPVANADVVPAFNPFALYGTQPADGRDGPQAAGARTDFKFQVLELLGVDVPADDGQELEPKDVADIVARFVAEEALAGAAKPGAGSDGVEGASAAAAFSRPLSEALPANTTILHKKALDTDDATEELERTVQRVYTVQRGDRLTNILQRMGGDQVQVRGMLEAMRQVAPEAAIVAGLQVHVTLVHSLTRPEALEPARFGVFTEAGEHRVSVMRNSAGDFIASAQPFESTIARAALMDGDSAKSSSIYSAIYNAALTQGIPTETILLKLRVHAYDTDFRRRLSQGDFAEYFFDLREEQNGDGSYGDLLFTALATGGEIHRYWRFRTPDGSVDYYDENGNNSKKFLMRRPVRGETVRLASGFGQRFHPILRHVRPHNGIDWAGPIGTPILSAGNGVVEEAKYKGEFGNYIRIRHANGYQSSYAHMSRYAPRVREGLRVQQGEVIGYIGNTGLSAGPHLHFEILVNTRPVDPLSIQVPRERQLSGKQLADYQKERARVDELMRRQPVAMDNK